MKQPKVKTLLALWAALALFSIYRQCNPANECRCAADGHGASP